MSVKTDNFISVISEYATREYLKREKWILPSVCIAQAACESGWNLNAKTIFGIKGKGVVCTTKEFVNGEYITIKDSFAYYPNIEASVIGYYDFIANTPRYKNVLNEPDYKKAVYYLQHTTDGKSYATSPTYENTIIKLIENYDLTRFDKRENDDIYILSVADMKTFEEVQKAQENIKIFYPNLNMVIRKVSLKNIECL